MIRSCALRAGNEGPPAAVVAEEDDNGMVVEPAHAAEAGRVVEEEEQEEGGADVARSLAEAAYVTAEELERSEEWAELPPVMGSTWVYGSGVDPAWAQFEHCCIRYEP